MSQDRRRIAIATADTSGLDGMVSAHFGRCPVYTLIDLAENEIVTTRVEPNPHAQNHAPGEVPAFLSDLGADVVLTGGIGRRALDLFAMQNIEVSAGHDGSVRVALASYLGGEQPDSEPCAGGLGDCHDTEN